jgi:hypothetical protein
MKWIGRVSLVKKPAQIHRLSLPRFISGFENMTVSKTGELLSRNFRNLLPSFFISFI